MRGDLLERAPKFFCIYYFLGRGGLHLRFLPKKPKKNFPKRGNPLPSEYAPAPP